MGNIIFYTGRKLSPGHFNNNSKGKVGKLSIHNCLKFVDDITYDWTTQHRTDDVLCTMPKRTFFKFDI